MKFNLTIITLLIIFSTITIKAQNGSVNLLLAFPSGEFKENVKNTGVGIGGQFSLWNTSPQMPFTMGLNLGFMTYGSEVSERPFSSTNPDVTVRVSRSNNIVNFHTLFEISPFTGRVRPYIEGLFGGAYLYTSTEIQSKGGSQEPVASSTNQDDWAWSYGGGGGFKIYLTNYRDKDNFDGVINLFLDLKVRYLFGTTAEYLKPGSVTINNGQVYYDLSRSKTDLLNFQIGVTAYF